MRRDGAGKTPVFRGILTAHRYFINSMFDDFILDSGIRSWQWEQSRCRSVWRNGGRKVRARHLCARLSRQAAFFRSDNISDDISFSAAGFFAEALRAGALRVGAFFAGAFFVFAACGRVRVSRRHRRGRE